MDAFRAALDTLDSLMAKAAPDAAAVSAAFTQLRQNRAPRPAAQDLKRMFAHCYAALERWPYTDEVRSAPGQGFRMYWQCVGLIEETFTDEGARHRSFMQTSVNRFHVYGLHHGEDTPRPAPPHVHMPLDEEEAHALAAPYLAMLEEGIAKQPYSHLKLAWNALRRPVTPFDAVFERWLADIDARGLGSGNSLPALRTAMALSTLAREGRQHLHWDTVKAEVLPKLEDPHPMVAANAGAFIGMLMGHGAERIVRSTPPPLREFLDVLANVKGCRRAVAGGFVEAFDGFTEVQREAGEGFDLDAWVLAILAHPTPEPYVPGTQAFWFPVHEFYWRDVAFMHRLLDAGNDWVAYMCATEGAELELVRPILDRIAAGQTELAQAARDFIRRNETPA
ncbi:hypothetical protein [Gymnodinialimonas sp.]